MGHCVDVPLPSFCPCCVIHGVRYTGEEVVSGGKSPGVVEFRNPMVTVPDLLSGVSLPGLGWAIA
ncbi:hypothetical protein BH09ACT7_BH09ACT7_20510 [soil metagenome]